MQPLQKSHLWAARFIPGGRFFEERLPAIDCATSRCPDTSRPLTSPCMTQWVGYMQCHCYGHKRWGNSTVAPRHLEHLRGRRGSNRQRMHNCLIICGSAAGSMHSTCRRQLQVSISRRDPSVRGRSFLHIAIRIRRCACRKSHCGLPRTDAMLWQRNGLLVVATAALMKNYIYYKWPATLQGSSDAGN